MQPQIRLEQAMHTQCFMQSSSSLLLAQLTSPHTLPRHISSSTSLSCFVLSLPPHHSHLPASLDLPSLLCSFDHCFSFAFPAISPSRLHSAMAVTDLCHHIPLHRLLAGDQQIRGIGQRHLGPKGSCTVHSGIPVCSQHSPW